MWISLVVAGAVLLLGYWYLRNRPPEAQPPSREVVIADMRSRAQRAVQDAKSRFGTTLDFSPESVEMVESLLGQIHTSHVGEPLADAELTTEVLKWGAYVGEVIKRVRQAEWRLDSDVGGGASLPIVYADGSESFPVGWCYKRIVNGDEDNIWTKFKALVLKRDADFGEAVVFGPDDMDDELHDLGEGAVDAPATRPSSD